MLNCEVDNVVFIICLIGEQVRQRIQFFNFLYGVYLKLSELVQIRSFLFISRHCKMLPALPL